MKGETDVIQPIQIKIPTIVHARNAGTRVGHLFQMLQAEPGFARQDSRGGCPHMFLLYTKP